MNHYKIFKIFVLFFLSFNQVFSQITLLKDINTLGKNSPINSQSLTNIQNKAFFIAFNGICSTDGTSQGTTLFKDMGRLIQPGTNSKVKGMSIYSNERQFQEINGRFVFIADATGSPIWDTDTCGYNESPAKRHIWISDGTPTGTRILFDYPQSESSTRMPYKIKVWKDNIFYQDVEGRLWIYNLTNNSDIFIRDFQGLDLEESIALNNNTFLFQAIDDFSTGNAVELWATDGTSGGTFMVKDIRPNGYSYPQKFVIKDGICFFAANDGTRGQDLWRTDGTNGGTYKVKELSVNNINDAEIFAISAYQDKIFFSASDGVNGEDIWRSDGTSQNTSSIFDLSPNGQRALVNNFSILGSKLSFIGLYNDNYNLFLLDNSNAQPTVIFPNSFSTNIINIENSKAINGKMYMNMTTVSSGSEPWVSDGTFLGTMILKELSAGKKSSYPSIFTKLNNNEIVFTATSDQYGLELFKTDGTPANTTIIRDWSTGTGDATPYLITSNGLVSYFYVMDSTRTNNRIWVTDGTPQNTILSNFDPDYSYGMTFFKNQLYYFHRTTALIPSENDSFELWKSDAMGLGASLVKKIRYTSGSTQAYPLIVADSIMYFFANDGINGRELWKSDGTPNGTSLVKDINSGNASTNVQDYKLLGNKLILSLYTTSLGYEPWVSDGTPSGTFNLKNIKAGSTSSTARATITCNKNFCLFDAGSGDGNLQIWRTDGTVNGTFAVKSFIINGNANSFFNPNTGLASTDDGIYFLVNGDYSDPNLISDQASLWKSDGTIAGTGILKMVYDGPRQYICYPRAIYLVGYKNKLFFAVNDGIHGWEMWTSDRTEAGTKLLKDIIPGPNSSFTRPSQGGVFNSIGVGNRFYFEGYDTNYNKCWWSTDGTEQNTKIEFYLPNNEEFGITTSVLKNKLLCSFPSASYGIELGTYTIPECYLGITRSIQNGNWHTSNTWSCGNVPNVDDSVIIDSSHTINLTQPTNLLKGFTLNPNGNININNSGILRVK